MSDSSLSSEEVLRACANSRADADWREFIQRFHGGIVKAVYRAARRWDYMDRATLEELIQEIYLKLCDPHRCILMRFNTCEPGSAAAFIHVVATNCAIDHFKSMNNQKHGGGKKHIPLEDEPSIVVVDGGQTAASALDRELLLKEIDSYLQAASTTERDRQIFWYYYRHGMSAREIAELPSVGLSIKGVESAISRLTQLVRDSMAEARLTRK